MPVDDSNNTSDNTGNHIEKRRFTRVPFVTKIDLIIDDDTPELEGTVVDISLKGILINIESTTAINNDMGIDARIHFDNGINIKVGLELAHHHATFYGFSITQIDLDGISHLRNIDA